MGYSIYEIIGKDHSWRGVFFVDSSEDKKVSAKGFYDSLADESTTKRMFKTRFDTWRDRQPNKTSRYHGWNKSEFNGKYTKCFVFKYKSHRLYGFLCNPKASNGRYQACVLVNYAVKNQSETDETSLKCVEQVRTTLFVQKAIKDFF